MRKNATSNVWKPGSQGYEAVFGFVEVVNIHIACKQTDTYTTEYKRPHGSLGSRVI